MRLKFFFLPVILLYGQMLHAQYYYTDLLTLEQNRKKMQLYRSQQVHRVKVVSSDAEGRILQGFEAEQEVSKDHSLIRTVTRTDLSGTSVNSILFDKTGRQIQSTDSLADVRTVIDYTYSLEKLIGIKSITSTPGNTFSQETHEWYYDEKGHPKKMLLIRNGGDTGRIDLVTDEKGWVLEERIAFPGKKTKEYYYYYDEKGNLTDIVRFNSFARRLLPDFVFEYEAVDRVGSMLTISEDGREYQQWYYSYDEDGLRILDACYSKDKTLIAKLEYAYIYY
jgi:hypothetical protein